MTGPEEFRDVSVRTKENEMSERLQEDIIKALKTVYDPEIPTDIYELGLIYNVDWDGDTENGVHVQITMTLTAPGCPVAGDMPIWVENAVSSIEGVKSVTVDLTFDPPWEPARMSDEARASLDLFW